MTDLGMAAKLRAALELSPTILAVTDLEDGRLLEVNDAFLRATGYVREEIIGRPTVLPQQADPDVLAVRGADPGGRLGGAERVPR